MDLPSQQIRHRIAVDDVLRWALSPPPPDWRDRIGDLIAARDQDGLADLMGWLGAHGRGEAEQVAAAALEAADCDTQRWWHGACNCTGICN